MNCGAPAKQVFLSFQMNELEIGTGVGSKLSKSEDLSKSLQTAFTTQHVVQTFLPLLFFDSGLGQVRKY